MNAGNYIYDEGGVYIRNMANMGEKYGVDQYRYPHVYELEGKEFTVEADGKTYQFNFVCKYNVVMNGEKYEYECLKAEPGFYYVRFGYNVLVVDLPGGRATIGMDGEYVSGVVQGVESDAPVHAPAGDEMVDTKVRWTFGCKKYLEQSFVSADKVLAVWSPHDEKTDENSYRAIKLRGPYYLVDMEVVAPRNVCCPVYTTHVVLLEDFDRCMAYGCFFGNGMEPVLVTGYAAFPD